MIVIAGFKAFQFSATAAGPLILQSAQSRVQLFLCLTVYSLLEMRIFTNINHKVQICFFFFCLKLFSPFCDVLKQRNTTATPSNPHPTQTLKKQKEMSQSMKVELLELNVVLGFFFFFLIY